MHNESNTEAQTTPTLDYPETLFNLEIEQTVLGVFLANNEALNHALFLRPSHFLAGLHQQIFRAILDFQSAGKVATPMTLKAHFSDKESLDSQYLVKLVANSNSVVNISEYSHRIVDLAQRRALYQACKEAVVTIATTAGEDPTQSALTLAQKFHDVSTGFDAPIFQDDYQVVENILEDMNKDCRPYPTGITGLDDAMGGGLYPGKSYGFAARKKMGKTILAGTISCNLNIAGVRHLFICGEMSPREIHQRTVARLLQIEPKIFRNKREQTTEFLQRVADTARSSKRCILYKNAPGLTFEELKRIILLAKVQKKITGFILDYWQLVGGKPRGKSTSEHLDEVAQWIADISRQYELWNITMAQINQEGNTRGGEGLRLSFDQVYELRAPEDSATNSGRWFEMMDTRYTSWSNVGSPERPSIHLKIKGPYFDEESPGLAL